MRTAVDAERSEAFEASGQLIRGSAVETRNGDCGEGAHVESSLRLTDSVKSCKRHSTSSLKRSRLDSDGLPSISIVMPFCTHSPGVMIKVAVKGHCKTSGSRFIVSTLITRLQFCLSLAAWRRVLRLSAH